MTDTFREARESHVTSGLVFGNPSHFGSIGTYTGLDGVVATRTVDGVVLSTIVVDFQPSGSRGDERLKDMHVDHGERQDEITWIDLCKDPEADRGGVAEPRPGDTFLREGDAPSEIWSMHEIVQEDDFSWLLEFRRERMARYGSRRGPLK